MVKTGDIRTSVITEIYIDKKDSGKKRSRWVEVGKKAYKRYVSRGIISQITSNNAGLPRVILFDITANPGASGSALVNQNTGDLIATVTWGAGRTINIKDILSTLRGNNINIEENQNFGFSVFEIISFLKDNKYY